MGEANGAGIIQEVTAKMGLHTIRLYLEPNPGGVYTVTSPDVPGLVTEGGTPAEITNNVQEALDALVEAWRALGRDLPPALRPVLTDRPQTVEALVSA
jgi:antitoxin HicB